jgi:hypothetical protein
MTSQHADMCMWFNPKALIVLPARQIAIRVLLCSVLSGCSRQPSQNDARHAAVQHGLYNISLLLTQLDIEDVNEFPTVFTSVSEKYPDWCVGATWDDANPFPGQLPEGNYGRRESWRVSNDVPIPILWETIPGRSGDVYVLYSDFGVRSVDWRALGEGQGSRGNAEGPHLHIQHLEMTAGMSTNEPDAE